MKDHLNVHSVNSLYLAFNKLDGQIEESNGNKYLNFVSTDKNKEVLTEYTELWYKIRRLVETIDDKSDQQEKVS